MSGANLRLALAILLLTLLFAPAAAQDCAPPQVKPKSSKTSNIFSPEQEMILGDLTYQNLAREMRFVRDPQLVAHINTIAEKLIKHLPPTGLKFQFFIIDIPEANAFDVAGGYIFVSRKLVALTNNEDELAGVIGHELGHAVARHGAVDFSVTLKKLLNVTSVGDRKDIAEKYNLIIERWKTKKISREIEDASEQLEADRIGLFAIVAAGYDPEAVATFFSRLVEAKPGSGGWFSDIFGKPKPEEKRLREIIKTTQQLPAQCRETPKAIASEDFLKWQADVVSYRYANLKEEVPGLVWRKELSPRLRSDISHFAFSNDGNFLLAQDDFAITIMQRQPLAVLLQIPVNEAHPASFTPDNQFVVFGTKNLRYEKWSLAEKKPVQMRELVVRSDCWEHGFSPDGNYLVCFDRGLNLSVLETQTGKKVWSKPEFYRLTFFEYIFWRLAEEAGDVSERNHFFQIQFSPDSQTLLIARTNKFRFRFTVNLLTADESDKTVLGLDMKTLKPIGIGGDLKKIVARPFLFLDSGRILGMGPTKADESGIFAFPNGKRLDKFTFFADELKHTANPNYVILKPLSNAKMGVFDVTRKSLALVFDKDDAAVWGTSLAFESVNGEVKVSEFTYDEASKENKMETIARVDIPVASVSALAAAEVSGNLQWLAASSTTRGAVWNLVSGERKLHVRGFRGALLANDGNSLVDVPKREADPRALVILNPTTRETRGYAEVPERGFQQYGRFLLTRKSLKAPKETKQKEVEKDKPNKSQEDQEADTEQSLEKEVRFELSNVLDGKVVFTREFPKEAPRYFFDANSGRLILYWTLGSDVGRAKLKEDPTLAARAKELDNKDDDYLMEIVDCFAGKTIGILLIETGKGSFSIDAGLSEGNWLVLGDSEGRVLSYSISDGFLRQRFFGTKASISPTQDTVVVENYPGELTFFSMSTGDIKGRVSLSDTAVFMKFSTDGKSLFVLSGKQVAYVFNVEKLAVTSPGN